MTFSVEIGDPSEVADEGHSVQIYLDREELTELAKNLKELSGEEIGEHLHYFTKSWGPDDLSEETHVEGNQITHHLKITLV